MFRRWKPNSRAIHPISKLSDDSMTCSNSPWNSPPSYEMRCMMSLPPNRWGFSNEAVWSTSPDSRSTRFMTTVVVPTSIARPYILPL